MIVVGQTFASAHRTIGGEEEDSKSWQMIEIFQDKGIGKQDREANIWTEEGCEY